MNKTIQEANELAVRNRNAAKWCRKNGNPKTAALLEKNALFLEVLATTDKLVPAKE